MFAYQYLQVPKLQLGRYYLMIIDHKKCVSEISVSLLFRLPHLPDPFGAYGFVNESSDWIETFRPTPLLRL